MKKLCAIVAIIVALASCTHRQIAFNAEKWKAGKNRYYMTDSLIAKLESERPNRSEIFDLLGKPELSERISETEVSYFLKSESFICGLAMAEFYIFFDGEGNFVSATVVHSD